MPLYIHYVDELAEPFESPAPALIISALILLLIIITRISAVSIKQTKPDNMGTKMAFDVFMTCTELFHCRPLMANNLFYFGEPFDNHLLNHSDSLK